MKNDEIYGIVAKLQESMHAVECWNFSNQVLLDLQIGSFVKIGMPYGAQSTTVTHVNEDGKALAHPGNNMAYRFIVPNEVLKKATGLPIPDINLDVVGAIIEAESGEDEWDLVTPDFSLPSEDRGSLVWQMEVGDFRVVIYAVNFPRDAATRASSDLVFSFLIRCAASGDEIRGLVHQPDLESAKKKIAHAVRNKYDGGIV